MRALILPLAIGGVALMALLPVARSQQEPVKLRVGTYDNRAIAVAYVHSDLSPVKEKMREMEAAKAAGDTKRVAELEAWGEKHQRALHRQGFGRVPVDDLLDSVRERLPEAARKAGVDAIAWQVDHAGPGVEVIDVTDDMVALFDPTPEALRVIAELRRHPPVDLDEIERGHEH
jgi:hypothetical protein